MYRVYACFALQKGLTKKRRESGIPGKAPKHSVNLGVAAEASSNLSDHPPTLWAPRPFHEHGTEVRAAALHDLMRLLHVHAQS
jgi:hypothetical protein